MEWLFDKLRRLGSHEQVVAFMREQARVRVGEPGSRRVGAVPHPHSDKALPGGLRPHSAAWRGRVILRGMGLHKIQLRLSGKVPELVDAVVRWDLCSQGGLLSCSWTSTRSGPHSATWRGRARGMGLHKIQLPCPSVGQGTGVVGCDGAVGLVRPGRSTFEEDEVTREGVERPRERSGENFGVQRGL